MRRTLSTIAVITPGAPARASTIYDRDAAGAVRGWPAGYALPPVLRPRGRAAPDLRRAGPLPAPAYCDHRPTAQRKDLAAALSHIDHPDAAPAAAPWPAYRLAHAGRALPLGVRGFSGPAHVQPGGSAAAHAERVGAAGARALHAERLYGCGQPRPARPSRDSAGRDRPGVGVARARPQVLVEPG